jgi:hypothetical protein
MNCIAFAINIKGRQPSQFKNFTFNSMVNFNGVALGVNNHGLFSLTGDKDNTALILAEFETVMTDMGIKNPKRLRYAYIGFESNEDLLLTVTVNENAVKELEIPANKSGQQRTRVPIGRDIYGRYWSFRISNPTGGRFAIDSVDVLPIIRNEWNVSV